MADQIPASCTKYHHLRLVPRLVELGKRHGIKWKNTMPYQIGDYLLSVCHPDPKEQHACGGFGTLSQILSKYPWRCGHMMYGYKICHVLPENGWLFMRTADIVKMLDDEKIPE